MRIELKKQNIADECYDELAYIAFKFKKFLKDPQQKVLLMGPLLKKYTRYASVATFLMLALWMLLRNSYFFYLAEISFFTVLFLMVYKTKVSNYIASYKLTAMKEKTLEINEEAVIYETEDQTHRNSWNSIFRVLINEYTVVFLPKEATTVCIVTSSAYADQVIEAMKQAGKEELIIDNRTK